MNQFLLIKREKRNRQRASAGVTLIELLIGMAILGVILLAASGVLQVNQRATNDTQIRSNALGDARGAISRITETLSQAAYIYPEGSVITLSSNSIVGQGNADTVKTGRDAVAVLLANGTGYEGVIYYLANRSEHKLTTDLPNIPADRIAQKVLVEVRTTPGSNIAWPAKTRPDPNWNVPASEGVLVDGVFDGQEAGVRITNLMGDYDLSPSAGSDGQAFTDGLQGATPPIALDDPNALISTLAYSIGIRVATNGKTLAESSSTVLRGLANSRNIPRR
jgi:prepilin-type N-terminal cleavage/methylation domain-containing protein